MPQIYYMTMPTKEVFKFIYKSFVCFFFFDFEIRNPPYIILILDLSEPSLFVCVY